MIRIHQNIIRTMIEYLFILFIILDCNTVYAAAANTNYYITEIVVFLSAMLLCDRMIQGVSLRVLHQWATWLLCYYLIIILCIIYGIAASSFAIFTVRFVILFPLFVLIFCILSREDKK